MLVSGLDELGRGRAAPRLEANVKDKICLVTGSTSGTGYVTALELAKAGATVVMLCRNEAKGKRSATVHHPVIWQ